MDKEETVFFKYQQIIVKITKRSKKRISFFQKDKWKKHPVTDWI